MVPGVVWLEVQVIYLQNTRYWLTSAGCEVYIAGLYWLCIKPHTSYLWCGAGCRNSSLSVKPCSSYLSQRARLRLECQIIALYKTAYFLRFASCEVWVRAGVFKRWCTGRMHPSYHFCAAPMEGKTEITQFTICYTTSYHLITTFKCGNFQLQRGDLTIS
jgi:hypothetical protein